MSKVYHAKSEKFGGRVNTPAYPEYTLNFPDDYDLVAHVHSNELRQVYEYTNSIDKSWTENRGKLLPLGSTSHRSTSVGDVIVTREGVFEVAPVGFRNLHGEGQPFEAPPVPEEVARYINDRLFEEIG